MSAIAYITDSKMLELHRLHANKTMNFWRTSTKVNFTEFKKGDLVFFLSKDKEYMIEKEKGVVGFGKLKEIEIASPFKMWSKYETANGYNNYDDFKEALKKVSKNHELPNKISSFYLESVVFFQTPIFLSEFGINISKNVESYIYIKPDEIVLDILNQSKNNIDIWTNTENALTIIDDELLQCAINLAHKEIGDFNLDERLEKKAIRSMNELIKKNPICRFVGNSKYDVCLVHEKDVLIVLFNSKEMDKRLLIGQADLYKRFIMKYYKAPFKLYFKTSNGDKTTEELVNRY